MFIDILGIYPNDIEHAWERANDFMESLGMGEQIFDLQGKVEDEVANYFDWNDPTNSIIDCIFEQCKYMVEEAVGADIEISYNCNGYDSDIYFSESLVRVLVGSIDRAYTADILATGIYELMSLEQVQELADADVIKDVIAKLKDEEGDLTFYDSVEELGEDNADNGTREPDDTDESFGQFLIQSYRDGNSADVYFEFADGKVVVVHS